MNHQELKIKVFQRPGVRKEYESLEPEFKILREILSARQNAGLVVGVWKNQTEIRKPGRKNGHSRQTDPEMMLIKK